LSSKLKYAIGGNALIVYLINVFGFGVCMSSELKVMLIKVAVEDNVRKEIEFEEGINRYKSLLLRVAKVQPFDVLVSSEGTEQGTLNIRVVDLDVLERAHLLKGQTKETGRNVYRQYELTKEGAELVEKLSKET
jgi:hypothetical protein